jgi:hypothetical protein
MRQIAQQFAFFLVEAGRLRVDQTQRAQLAGNRNRERTAGVETDVRTVRDEWIVVETRVGQGVRHHQDFVVMSN